MTAKTDQELAKEIRKHILDFTKWFNEEAESAGLGITLDPTRVLTDLKGALGERIWELYGNLTEFRVHREQVQTAVAAIAKTIENPGSSGIVLGALQSGKTGTAFMSLFAAPVHYLKTKVTYVPLFMTTNQKSHLMQTQNAMRGFFKLYGSLSIVSDGKSRSLIDYYAESGANLSPADDDREITLQGYTRKLSEEMYPGTDPIRAIVQGMTVKRVASDISKRVRTYCERARERGHAVMLIVDEPQYGASDRIGKKGRETPCLLSRGFQTIDEDFFSSDTPHFMIGLSATPYDTANLENLWRVNQRLNRSYVGPNHFAGEKIDHRVNTKAPEVLSFSQIGKHKEVDLKWFSEMPYLIGAASEPSRQSFKATKVDADGVTREMLIVERRKKGADLLRSFLDVTLLKRQAASAEPVGALLRIANNTRITEEVLDAMGVGDPDFPYNVIKFNESGSDAKQLIWDATRNDKRPYIVVTVGKGRMGDAFPGSTVMGVDLSHAASDANAFLQGVYGRMCGYGKDDPLVVVSDTTKELHDQLMENDGVAHDFEHSQHVKEAVSERGRDEYQNYFMITNEMIDADSEGSPLRAFRDDIVAYLETQLLSKETTNTNVPHRDNQFMNLPEIMKKHGIIKYVAEKSTDLDPDLEGVLKIADFDRTVTHKKRDGSTKSIGYLTRNGGSECAVLVSRVSYGSAPGETGKPVGASSQRGLASGGRREAAKHVNRGRRSDQIMPVITVKKVDRNGNTVEADQPGRYVFDGIVLQLEDKVRFYRPAVKTDVPVVGHSFRSAFSHAELGRQMGAYVRDSMYGKRPRSFDEALGTDVVQRIMIQMFDRSTHTYHTEGQAIFFTNLSTMQVDKIIDISDFGNVVLHGFEAQKRRDPWAATGDGATFEAAIDASAEPLALAAAM
jgi:hypothetical protein